MRFKRAAIVAICCVLASTFSFATHANATASRSCLQVLIKDRLNAVDDLISAQHFFTRDTTAFLSAVFGDGSVGELTMDYNTSLGDLAQDRRIGRHDIIQDRGIGLEDLASGRCAGASNARVQKELRFYHNMLYRLNVAYLQARLALTNAYRAAVANCCFQ